MLFSILILANSVEVVSIEQAKMGNFILRLVLNSEGSGWVQ